MRFEVAHEVKKSRLLRVRISESLAARYEKAAQDAGLDIGIVLRQALEFAAGDAEVTEKGPRKTRKGAK